jgi:hypothetical protein
MAVHNDGKSTMKITSRLLALAVLGVTLFVACSKKSDPMTWSLDKSEVSAQLKAFLAAQEKQAHALAEQEGKTLPPEFDSFFAAARKDDWRAATNSFEAMSRAIQKSSELRGSWWSATLDAYGVFELFPSGGEKYAIAFGNDIIKSIPDGSIYFGGTDPGRFLVTALSESHADGKPFFTLSQNPLPDVTYLHYLRAMYGGKIYTLTDEDSQKSFQDYKTDAQRRLSHDQQFPNEPRQLKPGEDVRLDSNGQIQLRGQMNVIGIRELLTKTIFDKNPDREFYVEESFPLDWMYPHLEPHGLIMKINRQPLTGLSDEMVQADRDYWTKYLTPMIGDWLNKDTSIEEIAAFAEKVYANHDFSGFKTDSQFIQSADAQKMFSKLRSSIGGLYAWRAQHATDVSEKERMNAAADFAFRQAFALCPYSLEAVFRYVNLLMGQNRGADALLVAETAAKMPSMQGRDGEALRSVAKNLEQFRKTK